MRVPIAIEMPLELYSVLLFLLYVDVGRANIQISERNRIICPNTVGLYQCTVFGVDLRWMVNSSRPTVYFTANDSVGTLKNNTIPNVTAILIERKIANESTVEGQGTRESILKYTPPPDYTGNITLACSGGNRTDNYIYVVGGKCHYSLLLLKNKCIIYIL